MTHAFVALTSLLFFLVVPTMDQLACTFCGPSSETTATARPVPHTEDDCVLRDGFEQPSSHPDGPLVHIHFCVLHATSLALTQTCRFDYQPESERIEGDAVAYESLLARPFFHPPAI